MRNVPAIWLIGLLSLSATAEPNPFSADSAYATIEHLSVTIGPRPMGSEQERRALRWVRDRFARFGADSAFILPFTGIDDPDSPINTNSGVAVGIFRGRTDTAIVIGGHVDSAGPDIPGADDNASGAAVMLELARIWSGRPRHYTLIFTAFGGEEKGLLGSKQFVREYADIDSVALMFSLDMAGRGGDITILSDLSDRQAPEWLIRDAFRIDRDQGIRRLAYWPHFTTVNMVGRGAGSDHIPFLRAGIPAIDFTAGLNRSPIHTPQDGIARIETARLAEYGRFVHYLLLHYQQNRIPPARIERYMLLSVFGVLLFVPHWLMIGLYGASLAFGTAVLLSQIRRRWKTRLQERGRLSGLKLTGLFFIVLMVSLAGQYILYGITAVRHPWVASIWPYAGFSAALVFLGAWLAARIARRWRFCTDPTFYAVRMILLIELAALLFGPIHLRMALYPAAMLVSAGLFVLVRPKAPKWILLILTFVPAFQLAFHEAFPELARTIPQIRLMVDSTAAYEGLFVLLQLLLLVRALPLLFGLAYLHTGSSSFRKFMETARKPAAGAVLLLLVLGTGWRVARRPAYNDEWRPFLHVNAEYAMHARQSRIRVTGTEYLHSAALTVDSLRNPFPARAMQDSLDLPFNADWISVTGGQELYSGEKDTLLLSWRLHSSRPWQAAVLEVIPDTGGIDTAWSEQNMSFGSGKATWRWLTYPPDTLRLHAGVVVEPGTRLIRNVRGRYGFIPLSLELEAEGMNVRFRTEVTRKDTIAPHSPPSESGIPDKNP